MSKKPKYSYGQYRTAKQPTTDVEMHEYNQGILKYFREHPDELKAMLKEHNAEPPEDDGINPFEYFGLEKPPE